MKNLPELWYNLPYCIQESLVCNCELDYDYYEGSWDEAKSSILNNPNTYTYNGRLIQEYYKQLNNEELDRIIKNNLENLKRQVLELEKYLT